MTCMLRTLKAAVVGVTSVHLHDGVHHLNTARRELIVVWLSAVCRMRVHDVVAGTAARSAVRAVFVMLNSDVIEKP